MDVGALQRKLDEAGYNPGTIDGILGSRTYGALLAYIGRKHQDQMTADLGRAMSRHLPDAEITTPLRLRHALAQWAVETGGFIKLEENLNYSATRMCAVWPRRFPNIVVAAACAHQPQKLAEKVYGGREGNTNEGDGWRFRGRGLTMLTFRDNYAEAGEFTGLDLVGDPDLVANPYVGTQVACVYWSRRKINQAADRDDIVAVRKLVNGGTIGIEEAQIFYARAAKVIA